MIVSGVVGVGDGDGDGELAGGGAVIGMNNGADSATIDPLEEMVDLD